jgi:WD40 repeat protein
LGEPLTGHSGRVFSVAFSPDGKIISSGGMDNTVRLWSTATGKQLGDPLKGHSFWIRSVAFSPDGSALVSCSDDLTVRVWFKKIIKK